MTKKRKSGQQLVRPQFDFKVTETIHEETDNSELERRRIGSNCFSKVKRMVSVPCKPSAAGSEKYADAVESIPLALAENAGMSVIDTQAELRTKSKEGGKARYGIDVFKGKVADLSTRDIYEPLTVKNQVINSATEQRV